MEAGSGLEPATATLPIGSRFEDRYEILAELGSGSFGRVYQARQLSTGQSVAIKLLAPREGTEESAGREVERFRRETRICAELSHVHIVQLIDSGETQDGELYAVFAYVPGETLEQALSRERALGVRECVRLMTQVLEALACAHAKGIVHRDLKPAKLMLSAAGVRRSALVLDFGLGGLAEGRRRQEWQTLTQTREFLGTPLYASPEQLAGEKATARSDLYAWGLVFLECLTGRHSTPRLPKLDFRFIFAYTAIGSKAPTPSPRVGSSDREPAPACSRTQREKRGARCVS
jgi:serine/threonine protein kinase